MLSAGLCQTLEITNRALNKHAPDEPVGPPGAKSIKIKD